MATRKYSFSSDVVVHRQNMTKQQNESNQFFNDAVQSDPSGHRGFGVSFTSTRFGRDNESRRSSSALQEDFELPGPDVFSQPSDQFRIGLNPDPESFR